MLTLPNLEGIGFYLVTDTGLSKKGTVHDVTEAVRAGCLIVQYREKDAPTGVMVREANEISEICRGRAIFLVNDRIDVAMAVDADGVHIGQSDMPFGRARRILGPEKIIGLSASTVEEAVEAERLGADYVGLGPIYPTGTKADADEPCGVETISEVKRRISIPIIVIGGLNVERTADVIAAGADGLVAISAVVASDDVFETVKTIKDIIRRTRQQQGGTIRGN